MVLSKHTITIHKSEVRVSLLCVTTPSCLVQLSPAQVTIYLRDVSNIERIDLKPHCLLLEAKDKGFYLSLTSDDELCDWLYNIYNLAVPMGATSSDPTDVVHKVHVGFDPLVGEFTVRVCLSPASSPCSRSGHQGMPDEWAKLLAKPNITTEDYTRNSQAFDALESYTDYQEREMEESEDKPEEQRLSMMAEVQILEKLRQVVSRGDPTQLYTKIRKVGQGYVRDLARFGWVLSIFDAH